MDDLKRRQDAGAEVEKRMLSFLMQFTPAGELKVGDAKQIAFAARNFSFEEFSKGE